jgi:hypothetical protein
MLERWSVPLKPDGHDDRGCVLVVRGQRVEFLRWHLFPEDMERVRLGYACIKCLTPHEQPYPEECSNCLLPMRMLQDSLFARLYEGEIEVGPQISDEDEWERLKEEFARERHQPGSSILIPGRDF